MPSWRGRADDLAGCEAAFDAQMLTREGAGQDYGEQRLISLGWLHRLISCREANPHEQEAYFREYPKI